MDAPEISILREDDEDESPPPQSGRGFTKFRVSMRNAWDQSNSPPHDSSHFASGSAGNNPAGRSGSSRRTATHARGRRGSLSDNDNDEEEEEEEEEEDQLIDDEETFPKNEPLRGLLPNAPSRNIVPGNATPDSATPTPRKRGGPPRGRSRRGGATAAGGANSTGRRGRPGREPPDAAAMMSTFELGPRAADDTEDLSTRPEPPAAVSSSSTSAAMNPTASTSTPTGTGLGASSTSAKHASSNLAGASPSPAVPDGWSVQAQPPAKPPRKKPGPKKGTTLGPRGPRKNAAKTANNTPGTSTPLDDSGAVDASAFLVPAVPSVPATPKPEQHTLPSAGGSATPHQQQQQASQGSSSHQYLPPILPPDFNADPTIPVPLWPLPTRAFPVQPPPKIPTGYAPSHPLDTKRPPARKWTVMKREIRGIAGGRWFTKTWVSGAMPDTPDVITGNSGNNSNNNNASAGTAGPVPNDPDPNPTLGQASTATTSVPPTKSDSGLGLMTRASSPPQNQVPAMSTSAAAAALLEVSKREHERELAKDREREKEKEREREHLDSEMRSSGLASVPLPPQRELTQLDHLAQAAATFSRLPELESKSDLKPELDAKSITEVGTLSSVTPAVGDMEVDEQIDVDTDIDVEMSGSKV